MKRISLFVLLAVLACSFDFQTLAGYIPAGMVPRLKILL